MKEMYLKLIRNLQFYNNNLPQFRQQYPGKYLLIWEETLAGVYASHDEAQAAANATYDPGTYLLKHCQPENKVQKIAAANGIFRAVS